MSGVAESSTVERPFRCSAAARWMPRVLAGSLLAAALIVTADRETPAGRLAAFAGAAAALWIVRQGGELRTEVTVDAAGVIQANRGKSTRLDFERIDSIGFAPPFSSIARPLPAALLIDRFGTGHRVTALLEEGERFVEQLVERSRRDDLTAWIRARGVAAAMGRARLWTAAGYLLALAGLLAALFVYLR